MQSHWRNNRKIQSRKRVITIKIQKPKSDVGKSKITIKIQHPKSDYDVHKIKIQQPWSGKCFDNKLTSSTRHSISQYIAIYAIFKGHRTPCTATKGTVPSFKQCIFARRGPRRNFILYLFLFTFSWQIFFPFWKSGKSERSYFLALFNSEIGTLGRYGLLQPITEGSK